MTAFIFIGMEPDFGIQPISLALLFVPLLFRLYLDYETIVIHNERPNHSLHTAITGALMAVLSVIVWYIEPVKYCWQPFLLMWGIFGLFFDYLLNILRKKEWYYITVDNPGIFDRAFLAIGVWGELFFKLWWLLTTFSVYFYMSYITG